ncbi:MAG: hypothetical protein R3F49_15580 [Planctomycetota bacterium]
MKAVPRTRIGGAAAALALAVCASLASCLAVAASGVGIFVSSEFIDNAHVIHYDREAGDVWTAVRAATLDLALDDAPVLDDAARTAELVIEGGRAAIRVEATGAKRCRLLVGARKFGVHNAGLAHLVLVKLDDAVSVGK